MTTSYNSVGGTGDRRGIVTATTTASIVGTFSNIIDGTQTHNLYFTGAQSGREMLFDFGAAAAGVAIIDEFTWYQDITATQGTWTIRASDDNATWTSLATGINLGGSSATEVHAFTNTTGYRYYSLLQTAGTTNTGPYINEIAFKISGLGAMIVDGEAQNTFGGTGGTVTLTTTLTDDIIIVLVANETLTSGAFRPVSTLSGGGLTWTLRKQLQWNAGAHTNANNLEVWWAHAPTALSGVVITVAFSGGSVDDASMCAFAVHGADTTSPFDPNGSLPASNTGTSSDPSVGSVSTTAANSFLFSVFSTPHNGTSDGPNTGFTKIANFTNGGGTDFSSQQSQYKEFIAAQSGITVTYNGLTQNDWGMIVDSLQPVVTTVSGPWTSTEAADASAFTGLGDIMPDTTIILPGEGGAEPTTLAKVGVSAGILLPGGDTYYPPPPPSGTSGSWASTETKDAMAFAGGVLGGAWYSTEYTDTLAFIESPHGSWHSTDAADAMAFAAPAQGTWDSTEADDAMDFAGHPELYGIWASTEADDTMSGLGGVLGGSWHSTDAEDVWASTVSFPPYGSWESTETTDNWAATGHIPPRGTWASIEGTDTPAITGDVIATFFDPTTASPGVDFQSLDLTIVNQEAFGQPVGAKSNTSRRTGKYYAEFLTFLETNNSGVGICNALADFANWGDGYYPTGTGPAANGAGIFAYTNGSIWVNGIEQSNWPGQTLSGWPNGQIVSVAIDLDNNLIWFRVNGGRWNGITGADPAHGIASPRPPSNQPQSASGGYDISAITGGPIYLIAEIVGAYDKVTMNPGTSAFAYAVPAGFLAWDSALPISNPLQIDGYASSGVNDVGGAGGLMSGTITLSTTKTDDVIVLGVSMGGYWYASTVDHVTSSSGLVWHRRQQRWETGGYKAATGSTTIDMGLDIEEWWAHAPVALTGEVITVHNTGAVGGMALVAFGVSGANYTTPWDTHSQAGGYVDGIGNSVYFPATSQLSTKAANTFLFGFHGSRFEDAGVTQEPWTYVTSAAGFENIGYESFLSLVYQVVEEPQINTDVVVGVNVAGIGNEYQASSMMFDSMVAVGETGTAQEIVWYWDGNTAASCLQLTTGTTLQMSYSAVNFNLMVLLEVVIMSASGIGTVTSISESQGSLSGAGFQRRSRTTTTTALGPMAVEIWWGWMPGTHGADRPNNDTITINTAHMGAGDIIGAIMLGLHGATGALGLGDPFWDVNPAVPAKNSNTSGSPPPYATDISTTIPSDLVVAWTANNTTNVPGYTDPFVALVQDYPRTVVPIMQLNSVAPPCFTGFEYYFEPGLVTNETAEFLQTPEPNGWIVVADAIPVGLPQPPSGTMHISDQQDKFTHDGNFTGIGIASPGGWVGAPENHGTMAATEREDINGGTPNLGYPPFLGGGWLGGVAAHATWASTESADHTALYGWVLGFGVTGQLGATENKDRMASGNRATVTGTMGAVETKDRWGSEGLVLPPGRLHPTPPFKRRLLIIT